MSTIPRRRGIQGVEMLSRGAASLLEKRNVAAGIRKSRLVMQLQPCLEF